MAFMTWDNSLSVNIKKIDEQHKQLVAMVNDLHSAMGAGKGKEVMGSVLAGLVEYTKSHFATEEELLQKHLYPGYLAHKAAHDALTRQVADVMKKFQDGQPIVTVEVMVFLKDWLVNHIQNTDKKYTVHLNNKGVV